MFIKIDMYSIKNFFIKHQLTLATVESFTGGLIIDHFIAQPGASAFVKGALITYQNQAKKDWLGIDASLFDGQVISEKMVSQMISLGHKKLVADVIIASSGNAGPTILDGKPIGWIVLGVGHKDKQMIRSYQFQGTRQQIRRLAVKQAVNLLREFINTYY
jgi:nicotinamide-nucleotide amidase